MSSKTIYLVIGMGVDVSGGMNGPICPTWPDCDLPAGSVPEPSSEFDKKGHILAKGESDYSAVGGRVFDTEHAARGWLEYSDAGQRFKRGFLNVLVVRSAM